MTKDTRWDFELGDRVRLIMSKEVGTIIGRAEYEAAPDSFYVLYMAGDGRQVTGWWPGGHLVALEQKKGTRQ